MRIFESLPLGEDNDITPRLSEYDDSSPGGWYNEIQIPEDVWYNPGFLDGWVPYDGV